MSIDNLQMANILISAGFATRVHVERLWGKVSKDKNIGELLMESDLLSQITYDDLIEYINSLNSSEIVLGENINNKDENITTQPPNDQFFEERDFSEEVEVSSNGTPTIITSNDSDDLFLDPISDVDKVEIEEDLVTSQPQDKESIINENSDDKSLPSEFLGITGFGTLTTAIPQSISSSSTLDEILIFGRSVNASDIHLVPNGQITMRIAGKLVLVSQDIITSQNIVNNMESTLPKNFVEDFHKSGDAEFVYTIVGGGRYRMSIIKYRGGVSLTARIIPMSIKTFEQLELPQSCHSLTQWAQGLVLVTGPAGSGKTATLATLVEMINSTRNEHIITIEDPVETIFSENKSQITQREIGLHTLSQENALKGALRQDPDILVISELRDVDSIKLAVSAAETGHLVFGTMNTTNASRTIYRLIESFPADEQPIIRSMVSESLRGVICQQLIPNKDNNGVVAAFEVLIVNSAISNMIRKDEMHQLASSMILGKSSGMVIIDDSLMALLEANKISPEEAYKRSTEKDRFKPFLKEAK